MVLLAIQWFIGFKIGDLNRIKVENFTMKLAVMGPP